MNYRHKLEEMGVAIDKYVSENDFLILCPFHDDSNPSCEVHESTGVFFCFGCKTGGNFVKLYAELKGISYNQAKHELLEGSPTDEILENMLSILQDVPDEKPKPKYFSKKSFHNKYVDVVGTPGEAYLKSRSISRKSARRFDIRYGVEGLMSERVVFPIYQEDGKLLSYGGRTIRPDVQPKVRKASGVTTQVTLFGLYQLTGGHDVKLDNLILVEGEFDAIYLQQCGLNAVSTMGSSKLSAEQRYLLAKYTKSVIWSYDGDKAGRNSQVRGIIVTTGFKKTFEIKLPDGRDPNDLSLKEVKQIYRGYFN